MKYTLRNLVLHYLFWLIFFALGRLFFLVYYAGYISQQNISIGEVLLAFPSGLRLDTATFCYPGFIMLLFITLYSTFGGRLFRFLLQGFNYLLLTGYSLIIVGEAGIYEEWQTKLNFKALRYLAHPLR